MQKVFTLVLIKPTLYADDGYPIFWDKAVMPSNSLACLYGIACDCRDRGVLGDEVDIDIIAMDETGGLVDHDAILETIQTNGGGALIGLVGVQTNQFPRAMDLAEPFLDAGIPVCVGGFHVTGSLAMLPEVPPEIVAAQEMGISIFAGEAEGGRLDQVLHDARAGALKPLYDHVGQPPGLENQPVPLTPPDIAERTLSKVSSFDLGRGCPFECTFCCIINVQGRTSRYRTADDVERIIRANYSDQIFRFFITDDNLARNRNWEALFDRLIDLREKEGFRFRFLIQVDALVHRIPRFIEKAARAGVEQVFIGIEDINPDNLASVKKRQNRITEYRDMLLAWKKHPVIVTGAYIIGLPNDSRDSVLRDVDIIKRELPLDLLVFSVATPLPGSEDHVKAVTEGTWIDPDLNRFDLCHRVTHHPVMSDRDWDSVYGEAWRRFYTPRHMVTVLKRAAALGSDLRFMTMWRLVHFGLFSRLHGMFGYEVGWIRRKERLSRRPGLPVESPLLFYPKLWTATARTRLVSTVAIMIFRQVVKRIWADPRRLDYKDVAITPPTDGEFNDFGLFQQTRGGAAAVARHFRRKKR